MPTLQRVCRVSGAPFVIDEDDQAFYVKLGLPLPTLCPEERRRRRFTHRNERHLYHRQCALSGKSVISNYSPEGGIVVYDNQEWWSDKWDARTYGRPFDFSRPFFDQFYELSRVVPQLALSVWNSENSNFCNYVGHVKDSYLIFGSVYSEDCYYGSPYYSKDCVDTLVVRECEASYECVDSRKLYGCLYCQDCHSSSGLLYCYDVQGSNDCIGSAGLRNKQYVIFNQQKTKEEYEAFRKQINLCDPRTHGALKKELDRIKLTIPHRFMQSKQVEEVSGNYIYQSKNTKDSYYADRSHDVRYSAQVVDLKDCYDNNFTEENELCLEYLGAYQNHRVHFSKFLNRVSDSFYCDSCFTSKSLFGCIGIRSGEYCILNQQYTKEEYEVLVPRIIEHIKKTGEWGEFFPSRISPFGYNETVADEYFPLSKDQANEKGFAWKEDDATSSYQGPLATLPAHIDEVSDSIVDQILTCEVTGRFYKVIPQELKFYRTMKLPLPKRCPDQRHRDRLALRNPQRIWARRCSVCGIDIQTTYAPDRPERVCCEPCYLKEVF